MQHVERKQRKSSPAVRWILLGILALALVMTVLVWRWLEQPAAQEEMPESDPYGELLVYDAAEVAALTVTGPDGSGWSLKQDAGVLYMADESDFPLDPQIVELMLDAARVVSYSDVLTGEKADYQPHLADFGLENPWVVQIEYTDGNIATLRLGSRSDEIDQAFYYMLIDGDDRLFALDLTTANTLTMTRDLLHAVPQPVIHKARIDAVTLAMPDRTLAWTLEGSIQDADAADRWMLTSPAHYPADGERMSNLRENLANLRLGAFVCDATDEALTTYGFDTPRLVITLHQGAGTTGTVDAEGVYGLVDWPESTLTLTVGGAKNENVDYVLYDGCIYITSHFSLQIYMDMNAWNTLNRYPVLTSLSNLETLTVDDAQGRTEYAVTRTEMTDEDGIILQDEYGTPLMTSTVTRDGEAFRYDAFEASYNRMLIATVTGSLPENWTTPDSPHTTYTFTTRTGITHTIALTTFDALHDAVLVDGCAMFYMIRGGLTFAPENEADLSE